MKNKKIWWVVGLLILMWMSIAGQYINATKGTFESWWLAGLIDVTILTVVMIFIPLIFRLVNKDKLDLTRGKKICKWNSIGMFLLSLILSVILFDGNGSIGIGGVGAIMFYYINKWLFVSDEICNNKKIISKGCNDDIENHTDVEKMEKNYTRYCKLCGGKLDLNRKCKKCGKQYFAVHLIIKVFPFIIILILIIISIILLFKNINYKNKLKKLETNCDDITIDSNYYFDYYLENKDKINFIDENIVFVIDGYGDYAYCYDWMMENVDGEFTFWAYNKEQALSLGYKVINCN